MVFLATLFASVTLNSYFHMFDPCVTPGSVNIEVFPCVGAPYARSGWWDKESTLWHLHLASSHGQFIFLNLTPGFPPPPDVSVPQGITRFAANHCVLMYPVPFDIVSPGFVNVRSLFKPRVCGGLWVLEYSRSIKLIAKCTAEVLFPYMVYKYVLLRLWVIPTIFLSFKHRSLHKKWFLRNTSKLLILSTEIGKLQVCEWL